MDHSDKMWVHALYEKNAPKMLRVAARRLGDENTAHDIVDEAFIALIEKLSYVKVHPNPDGWLMKTAKYLILQEIYNKEKHLKHETPLEEFSMSDSVPGYTPPLRDILPPGLTEREKDLLVWYYEDKMSYEEITEKLGILMSTCRVQMFRAKVHYRELAKKDKSFLELM